ncbi:MAG: phosphopentomutase [Candidatus Zixiibacteriota bacterium]
MNRAIVIVLDACGIGEAPDSIDFGDQGSNTIVHTAQAVGGLDCPTMGALGLGCITDIPGVPATPHPMGSFGVMQPQSPGKDSTSGHWELLGLILDKPFPTYPHGFGDHILRPFSEQTGRGVLGNRTASGTQIIQELGDQHRATGDLIVYTSADSVFQIAAHEDVVPVDELYRYCEIARRILTGDDAVGRVIARPFTGESGDYRRTHRRRDFSVPPPRPTVIDLAKEHGLPTIGIGKIDDLFAGQGLTDTRHTPTNDEGMRATCDALRQYDRRALIVTNLVETDMLWGHRNDPVGFARALARFDEQLDEVLGLMASEDILFISADHGCDPTTPSTDHSREIVPLIVYSASLRSGIDLGVRRTFADLGATVAEALELPGETAGLSFLSSLR